MHTIVLLKAYVLDITCEIQLWGRDPISIPTNKKILTIHEGSFFRKLSLNQIKKSWHRANVKTLLTVRQRRDYKSEYRFCNMNMIEMIIKDYKKKWCVMHVWSSKPWLDPL